METSLSEKMALSGGRLSRHGLLLLCVTFLWAVGCQQVERTTDPQLKPIQEMLDAQLPVGTPEAKVLTFLDNRGFPVLPAGKQGTIVTKIRHIDSQTVTPVTAQVTFYFDANRKLNTYEMQRTFNEPVPKAEEQQAAPTSGDQPQPAQPTQP